MTKAINNANGGLTLVSTTALSAASSVSLTNLSVGGTYKIILTGYTSADNVAINARFREGSTDKATTYYGYTVGGDYASSSFTAAINNATTVKLTTGGTISPTAYYFQIIIDLNIASLSAANATVNSITGYANEFRTIGFANKAMSACNGISIYPASGTFTGSISLYKHNV